MGWRFPQETTGEVGRVRAGFPRGIAPLRRPVWDGWIIRADPGRVNAGARVRYALCGAHAGTIIGALILTSVTSLENVRPW